MIVQRMIVRTKAGRRMEVEKLARAERERIGSTHRIYRDNVGPHNTIAFEFEFKDFEEKETFWSEWLATSESDAFLKKWFDLIEAEGTDEIWTLVE
jgi:hypothetical protein